MICIKDIKSVYKERETERETETETKRVRCAVPVRRGYVRHWGPGRGCSLPLTGDRYGLSSSVNHSIWPSLYDEDSIPPSVPSSCPLRLFPSVTSSSSSFALPRRVGLSASQAPADACSRSIFPFLRGRSPVQSFSSSHSFYPSPQIYALYSISDCPIGPAGYCH